ncbi:hypothetical protein C0Q70_14343 [Pomacea canaliculata]|uniref:Uncharacterized protein n=1 Tax=Pomacea canaliculata TaxID=400727 RepID=A0A2T7NZS4_POMCA|nr:hypothetical protein C0Q70_14343 [Pomacea canaliculata]
MAVMPFSALLDFSDVIFGRVDRSALCQSDQVYDEEKVKVILTPSFTLTLFVTGSLSSCSLFSGRQYVRENCVPVLSSGLGLAYTLYFDIYLDTHLTLTQDVVRDFPVMLQSYLLLNILKLKVRFTEFVVVFDTTDENSTCSANTSFLALFSTLVVTREASVARIESQLLSLRNTTLSFGFRDQTLLLTSRPNERVWLNHFRHSKKGGACTVSVSIPLPVVGGDETLVYTRVNDLLPLPQMALFAG